jgi:PEP-CTERM/exosortase A-associated glycosyltransferase
MRVLHVLHHSLPVLDGYSLRTSYILRNQAAQGLSLAAVTSSQHPAGQGSREIDGIPVDRTPVYDGSQLPLWREWHLMARLRQRLLETARRFRPSIIHAHSPVLVGHPALAVARELSIPFVYEIRDLWENASVDRGRFGEHSAWYRMARSFETRVLRGADAVVTICEALRRELAARLGGGDDVYVVSNGVDTRAFAPQPRCGASAARWNLDGREVIGYVGTFQPYEGLADLVAALPAIRQARPAAHLLIVGGGDGEAALRELVERRALSAHVTFTGRLPHGEVRQAYTVADVLVYPRRATRTTRLTTPLKPLEAMAMAKPVLVSDLPPLRELIQPGLTGSVFRAGDADDLAEQCVSLLADPMQRERCGAAARAWVVREREWSRNVAGYQPIYGKVLSES